jgi:hypothetical protein
MIVTLCIVVGTIVLILILFAIIGFRWAYNDEKKHYNNGVCPQCGGKLKYFETDPKDGSRGYECPNKKCDYSTWVSWSSIDKDYGRNS